MKILIFAIIILVISSLIIIESNNFQITDKQNMNSFKQIYSGWINQVYRNTLDITGNAIKMDWLQKPE